MSMCVWRRERESGCVYVYAWVSEHVCECVCEVERVGEGQQTDTLKPIKRLSIFKVETVHNNFGRKIKCD